MPKTEKSLKKLVLAQNMTRTHHRALDGEYGYNHILNTSLVTECLELYRLKKSKIRVLDVGCGDGYALSQLETEIEKEGLGEHFEFYGMGINSYEKMYLSGERFIRRGVYDYRPKDLLFDLVFSVYTLQYVWHKLEVIENIYNSLMADHARAILHFPGYLVKFSENSPEILQSEVEGNQAFAEFVSRWNQSEGNPRLRYTLIPYYSDDNEILFTEFGNLRFEKAARKKLKFPFRLSGFTLFDEGFILSEVNKKLSYVSSIYRRSDPRSRSRREREDPELAEAPSLKRKAACRIETLREKVGKRTYFLHLAVHHVKSKRIIGIYPAAKEELGGSHIPYLKIAESLQKQKAAAVVRCNGLYDPAVSFNGFNDRFVRLFLDYILKNAESICEDSNPEICLMGYSSGGSAVASVAADYAAVKKLLLIAPSYDADKTVLKNSMNRFQGDLRIVTGDCDDVVLPSQAAWFYFQAEKARSRKFVELVSCDHEFHGPYHKASLLKAPFWAFDGSGDFPAETIPLNLYREETAAGL